MAVLTSCKGCFLATADERLMRKGGIIRLGPFEIVVVSKIKVRSSIAAARQVASINDKGFNSIDNKKHYLVQNHNLCRSRLVFAEDYPSSSIKHWYKHRREAVCRPNQ